MDDGPFSYVIAGGGTAGWMAAALLARFLPAGRTICLVESEAIGTVGVGEATIPQIHNFNRALGIDEADFLAATGATYKLGIEFDGWLREGEAYMHAFGAVGQAQGLMPFHQHWLRARSLGLAKPTGAYSLNEQAARAGRMHKGPSKAGMQMPYAYHFDAALYAGFLRNYAEAHGVTRVEGRIADVRQDSETGTIAALLLEGDRAIEGTFFLDCTGFRSLLIGGVLDSAFDEWTHVLPCDRALAVPSEALDPLPPYTRAAAHRAGWQWRIPLQHRTGNGIVYSSRHMTQDDAADLLLGRLDTPPTAEPRSLAFRTGMRTEPWRANCLALGLAAGFLEPMESTSIHLIQSALSRFLSVLPGDGDAPATRDWFNAQARFEWQAIRDFLVLHYHANARVGDPFWDELRDMNLPDTLAARLAAWRENGLLHREHEELFTQVGWFQVLAGQGVIPDAYNPLADAFPEAQLAAMLRQTEQGIARDVQAMRPHSEHLPRPTGDPHRTEIPA